MSPYQPNNQYQPPRSPRYPSAQRGPAQPGYNPSNRPVQPQRINNSRRQGGNALMIVAIIIGIAVLALLGFIAYMFYSARNDTDHQSETVTRYEQSVSPISQTGWREGLNTLHGTFYYNGATYGFSIKIDYDASRNIIRTVKYAPDNTGVYSDLTGQLYLSPDQTQLTINGTAGNVDTDIRVSGDPSTGTYQGEMLRGDHYGSCTITL